MSDNDETLLKGGEPGSPTGQQSAPDVAGAALGALSASEEAAVRAAAAADEQIAAELAELQAVSAELAWCIPLQQINRGRSAGIRSRLISRAVVSRDGRGIVRDGKAVQLPTRNATATSDWSSVAAPHVGSARGPQQGEQLLPHTSHGTAHGSANVRNISMARSRQFNWLALAAGLAFVLTGVGLLRVARDRDHLRTAVSAQQATMASRVAALQASVASKDSLIVSLTGPNMKVVDLVNYASQDPIARMFWDQKTQEWTMYAYNLRQPKPGKVFQVWLITNTKPQPISAGTFTPDAHGSAVLHAKYPLGRRGLEKVAVSEEPEGGVPYPTGPIIIAGAGT